jgi:putative hemolysin
LENEVNKTTIFTDLTILLISILVLSACASQEATQSPVIAPTETDQILDMANPAAVYCEGLGYSMETLTREGGQDADCIFPDGSRCGQWDILAGRCGQEFSYCNSQGFSLEPSVGNIGVCRFPDGSTCDEYQYFSGECAPGDNPGVAAEEPTQIMDINQARDFLVQYFNSEYGLQVVEAWIEQDITPEDAVASSKIRFVSGPITIVISAEASAPAPAIYQVHEAADLRNGFYWQGTLGFDGELTQEKFNPPGTILNTEDARDAIMQHITEAHDLPLYGEWTDQGMNPTDANTMVAVYTSGPWVVEVEFAPAAPLVGSYNVTVDHLQDELRWEGEITLQGDITENNFTK